MNNRLEIAREFAESINSDKIVKIILFGSVARGDDTEDSDIDILIISDYRNEIWEDIADIIGEIVLEKQELISAHIMSTERFNTCERGCCRLYSFNTFNTSMIVMIWMIHIIRI